jgi:hypothetical protein
MKHKVTGKTTGYKDSQADSDQDWQKYLVKFKRHSELKHPNVSILKDMVV